ncbi:hypothetical protein [Planococcus antarcticus]|uniref:hypothetical protein n=1 Tax=Planococcus antarcticus TaxID=161360 RepID=UPI0002F11873
MHSFWVIFQKAFMTKARTKSFIITTLVVVASFFLLANIPNIISVFDGEESEENVLHVLDETTELVPELQTQLDLMDSGIKAVPTYLTEDELQESITEGTIDD